MHRTIFSFDLSNLRDGKLKLPIDRKIVQTLIFAPHPGHFASMPQRSNLV